MRYYLFCRLSLVAPTLFIILTVNFFIVQFVPGGPVDQAMARFDNAMSPAFSVLGDNAQTDNAFINHTPQRFNQSARGFDAEIRSRIEKLYGFDKPIWERYINTIKNYLTFNFGNSFFKSEPVLELIWQRLPVSVSLGLWSTLLVYLISIPLGIKKASHAGRTLDVVSNMIIIALYAIPAFVIAIFFIIVFAGGTYFNFFPLRGLVSADFSTLSLVGKIKDYVWHITLPTIAMAMSGVAVLTLLTRNSFLSEIQKSYVITAKAKGLSDKQLLYRHVFRNAMVVIMTAFPPAFINLFFTGTVLVEIIFSLNGLGLLGYEAIMQRDYPIIFGTLYIFTLIGLLITILNDVIYTWIDPCINFEART